MMNVFVGRSPDSYTDRGEGYLLGSADNVLLWYLIRYKGASLDVFFAVHEITTES